MSAESVERLTDDIEGRIDYYRQEYDMTYAEVIGVLALIQTAITMEAFEEEADDAMESPDE